MCVCVCVCVSDVWFRFEKWAELFGQTIYAVSAKATALTDLQTVRTLLQYHLSLQCLFISPVAHRLNSTGAVSS